MAQLEKLVGRTLIGADPELFIRNKTTGKIVGSERVIPEGKNIVVRDGIQLEFNPPASVNADVLGQHIAYAFKFTHNCIKHNSELELCYDTVVNVEREELDALSEKSRILGCMPSSNIYGDRPILVDPKTYTLRSAGGHLHFGLRGAMFDDRVRLINWLDVLLGVPCVLLDSDPYAAVRRENYGRAGEYRITPYGIEYRTLSNFWLKSFPMLEFVVRQANSALEVLADGINGGDKESRLIDIVDPKLVVKAIEGNDKNVALKFMEMLHVNGLFLNDNEYPRFIKVYQFLHGSDSSARQDPYKYWTAGKRIPFFDKPLYF